MKSLITLSLLSLMAFSAMAENIQTIVYTPDPVMTCQNCEKKIKSNVRFVKGTKRIETSLKDQTVTITYDADKAKPEDFVAAFAKIGRKVKEVSVDDQKALKAEIKAVKADQKVEKRVLKAEKEADKKVLEADKKAIKLEKQAVKAEKKAVDAKKAEKTAVTPKKK